jgi:thiamine biosynthesis lipoprotein
LQTASDSVRRARPLLGTFVEIAVAGVPRPAMDAAIEAAFRVLAKVHRLMSFHEVGSDVWRLNNQASIQPVCVHPWTLQVLQTAIDLYRCSSGAFDIAVAPVLQEIGVLPRWRNDQPSATANRTTTEAINLLPGRRVGFSHPETRIDLGGIAKGFAVDRAIDVLRRHGMPTGVVNAGGDLAVFGPNPCDVDIRDPHDPSCLLCRVGLSNSAMASSGQCFDPFHSMETLGSAIINPYVGSPARAARGAAVRAPCCMLADALTKVVMIAGPSAIDVLEHCQAGALVVSADGSVQMTRDFESVVCLAA